jgi:hypothetical protein
MPKLPSSAPPVFERVSLRMANLGECGQLSDNSLGLAVNYLALTANRAAAVTSHVTDNGVRLLAMATETKGELRESDGQGLEAWDQLGSVRPYGLSVTRVTPEPSTLTIKIDWPGSLPSL